MRGGPPRITSHHIKRKKLTTNAPIVPRSSSILIISSRAGLSCPVPFRLVDRAKPARYAAGKSCELFSYDIYYDISYDIYYDMSMSAPCN